MKNIQRSILKSVRFAKQYFVTKSGLAILLVLVVAILMTTISISNHAQASTATSYTIISGDTLSGIGNRFGISVADLASANGIADPNRIYVGQVIRIPRGHVGSTSETTSAQVSGSYANMIHEVFGPYGDQAVRVAMCESGLNPNAYNGALGAAGLFQIIPGTWASTSYAGQSVYNPVANIQAAHQIFARDGYSWSEWAC